jgi:cell wall assembly regulator SMI1
MLLFNSITDVINYLKTNLDDTDITLNKGASKNQIEAVENAYNIKLPDDIRQFYEFTDGFISDEDMFSIIPLNDVIWNKEQRNYKELYIAEFMIYCDAWELIVNPDSNNDYKITTIDNTNDNIVLTNSFVEFLRRFLIGGLYEKDGLYDWRVQLKR